MLRNTRSTYRRIPHDLENEPEFDKKEAVEVILSLLAIDQHLCSVPLAQHRTLRTDFLLEADTDRLRLYKLADELVNLVTDFPGPRFIPATFLAAYSALLQGRSYQYDEEISDEYGIADRRPTCLGVLRLLPKIDALLRTNLRSIFDAAEQKVKPFPLLGLPAELRLQVYSYLLPPVQSFNLPLLGEPSRNYTSPRISLGILCTCQQLHAEVTKFLFMRQPLFLRISPRSPETHTSASTYFIHSYEALAAMDPTRRSYIKKLEIEVTYDASDAPKNPQVLGPKVPSTLEPYPELLKLLPNLESICTWFEELSEHPVWQDSLSKAQHNVVSYLIDQTPSQVTMYWDFEEWDDKAGVRMIAKRMVSRGGLRRECLTNWRRFY